MSILISCTNRHISLAPWCVRLDMFHCIWFPSRVNLISNIIPAFKLAILFSKIQLRIDHNFCSVHDEITSIRLYTPLRNLIRPDWGYFEWTKQIISINPYKLIQAFFVMILKNIFIFSKSIVICVHIIVYACTL